MNNYFTFDCEDNDEMFEDEKPANTFSSLLPLLLYFIVSGKHEGKQRAVTQTQIRNELKYFYGLEVDRKSISRTLYALQYYGMGVVVEPKAVYYEPLDDVKVA